MAPALHRSARTSPWLIEVPHGEDGSPLWDDGDWEGLAPLAEDASADVIVVGLGGSGLSAVAQATSAGASVIGLDAGPVASGAAGRNGGFLIAGLALFHHEAVESLGRARAVRAYRLTQLEIERMTAETPELIRRRGSLRIAMDQAEEEDVELQRKAMEQDGLGVQTYAGVEGRGLLIPGDAAFNPLARCRALARAAIDNGARLFERSPVVDIRAASVSCADGATVRGESVLVLVDADLSSLVPALADRVRSDRLHMLGTEPTDEVALPRPVYARWGWDYWQQLADGRLAVGGGRDQTADVEDHLERLLRDVIGVRRAAVTHRWSACGGFTADRLPVVEELPGRVWAAGGYSGTGNVVGSLCGRGLAELATTGTTELLI